MTQTDLEQILVLCSQGGKHEIKNFQNPPSFPFIFSPSIIYWWSRFFWERHQDDKNYKLLGSLRFKESGKMMIENFSSAPLSNYIDQKSNELGNGNT